MQGRPYDLPCCCYWTCMVTTDGLLLFPTVTTSVTEPDGNDVGTTAFTCNTPDTRLGASPAYVRVAGTDVVVPFGPGTTNTIVTGATGFGYGGEVTDPVTPGGFS